MNIIKNALLKLTKLTLLYLLLLKIIISKINNIRLITILNNKVHNKLDKDYQI